MLVTYFPHEHLLSDPVDVLGKFPAFEAVAVDNALPASPHAVSHRPRFRVSLSNSTPG